MEATEPKPKLPPLNCRLLPQRSGGYPHVLALPLSFRSRRSIHGANRATKTEELALIPMPPHCVSRPPPFPLRFGPSSTPIHAIKLPHPSAHLLSHLQATTELVAIIKPSSSRQAWISSSCRLAALVFTTVRIPVVPSFFSCESHAEPWPLGPFFARAGEFSRRRRWWAATPVFFLGGMRRPPPHHLFLAVRFGSDDRERPVPFRWRFS
jgi:hypothetical protein